MTMAYERFEALVSLNMIPEIGSIRLGKLLEFFGTPEAILNAPQAQLEQVYGIGRQISAQIHNFKKEDLEKEFGLAKKHQVIIITKGDAAYPENLKTIPDPPIALYVKGTLLPEDNLAMGIVGSRRASWYGLECAKRFAFELSAKGFTIVSGMARGVDTASHRGALEQGGRTIAVIGSGFNHIYPEENRELAEKIAVAGAVISEFPFDSQPLKQHFPQRNRVISGLSLGVLVVEAARNSGALITADFALEQGREVFALPGKVDSNTSYGTNGLIKQGAKLVTTVDDVLEEIALPVIQRRQRPQRIQVSQKQPEISPEESVVCHKLHEEPLTLDELVEKTNMDISRISGILLKLELKKLIKQLPGKLFVLSP